MFRPPQDFNSQQSIAPTEQLSNQTIICGLGLLVLLSVSVVGASWLLSVPVYFDMKIAAQLVPVVFSIVLLFAVSKLKMRFLYKVASPTAFIVVFSSWAYVIFLNTIMPIADIKSIEMGLNAGASHSIYILGLCLLVMWLARYFKFSQYLSLLSIIVLIASLLLFSQAHSAFLFAISLLLISSAIISMLAFNSAVDATQSTENNVLDPFNEGLLASSELDEVEIKPELEINALPLNENSITHNWELILRQLHGELKNTADVDQLFKSMLVFLHDAMEFDAAAVGMLQEKSIKKIASYGSDVYLHTRFLNWSNQRVRQLFSLREPMLSNQPNLSAGAQDIDKPIHRIDIPVLSNNKAMGVVTLFRESLIFDSHDVKLASSIVFHSMIALRQARLADEIKRLNNESKAPKLTLYTRQQFVIKVQPVFEKLAKPRECSLLIMDIDNLDDIINAHGRDAGTYLYNIISKSIVTQLRDNDLIGRYGNEGFVLLLDEADINQAKTIAENIRIKVENTKIKYKESVLSTTLSIGLTIVSNANEDLAALMRKADMGLFVAKENGCNTVKVSL